MFRKIARWRYDRRAKKRTFEPKTVSVITLTLGRTLYLKRLVESLKRNFHQPYEHLILNQGIRDEDFLSFLNRLEKENPQIKVIHVPENLGLNDGCAKLVELARGDLIVRFDEDVEVLSDRFIEHLLTLYNTIKEPVVLSAFPVGLLAYPGGMRTRYGHDCYYGKETDTYYVLRWVHHLGGFCMIIPRTVFEEIDLFAGYKGKLGAGLHDAFLSNKLLKAGFRLAYMENACVVEHQETAWGQENRMGKYFDHKKLNKWI